MDVYYAYRLQPGFHYPTTQKLKAIDVAELMWFIAAAEATDDKSLCLIIAESKARDLLAKKQPSSQSVRTLQGALGQALGAASHGRSRLRL
ncbi:MAG: hypothetical protein M1816_005987, partial [Peltula sp. TS41687]